MNSLLKTVNSIALNKKRNLLVRDSLQKQLNTNVMEMQSAPGAADDGVVGNCDESMSLCSVLEAIFLHGLKDSLLNRVTEALSGPDFDAMPQPSFWGPLLVFSHRQIIDQIQTLSQVTTEVGYCRAWIRMALNEGLLASYFCAIKRDNSALKPYYNRSAYIRDTDYVEVAQRLIENLDYVRFELVCNSSLLNFWSTTPLLIAGIWSPPMKSCPVFSAVDIAKTITTDLTDNENLDEIETASSIGSLGSFTSSQSMFNNIASITEDQALKIILANEQSDNVLGELHGNPADASKPDEANSADTIEKLEESRRQTRQTRQQLTNGSADEKNAEPTSAVVVAAADAEDSQDVPRENEDVEVNDAAGITVGNSLIGRLGWSTSFEECQSSLTSSVISHGSGAATDAAPCSPGDGSTYDALIQSYHTGGNSTVPNLQEFLKKYPKKETIDGEAKAQAESKVVINLEEQLGRLPREKGLDVQNYSCLDCGEAIGMTFSKAHICSYSGDYYCSKCMADGQYLVPSRMIHNWDLKYYPICQKAVAYLQGQPALLDMKILNPRIYKAVDAMARLQSLRIQLNLLRAYLFTCREPIIESLQKKVAPRDYLYEHVHQYSVSDFLDIPNGILAQQLQKVVEFARGHVINCWLCSQKGFICEVCNNPKVIYPFDMESTFRCGACNAVFHADCLNASKPCPKCERRRKRMDLPLLDMGCTDLPNSSMSSSPVDTN
ncbi:pleckstrin homology domain-containing family M member 1 [Harpegnathos saltator]|uniref:Pleckstrin-like proteiny domain-containing family M member 3 n=1 Tax=Harpegnathos saltator TaxID=610380 RepID=E2BUT6_HARSA|nr:pleckstrin homology domain-containing family M member 1 [Harpegnathos saltator]XP_025161428.1 pleckstrin homology domain-containing family M member 1 [Harpegnathos saltator]EFN80559.1 Pleckstrin-like proteiny domain-containing family M member 3 [Harpegnathos saltator]